MSAGPMRFATDLAAAYAWATPAPIGYVEPGWVAIVTDLLRSVDGVLSALPGATLDILDVSERDGMLELACVLDGGDADAAARVGEIVAAARRTSALTCPRCGAPRVGRPDPVAGASGRRRRAMDATGHVDDRAGRVP